MSTAARIGRTFFGHGFRPFFLAAGAWAPAALLLWLAVLSGAVVLHTAFDAVTWHAHEMLFGFVFAAVAGFLLTAVPSWTGRPPLNGLPLALLALLWVLGRIGVACSAVVGPGVAAVLDLALPAALVVVIGLNGNVFHGGLRCFERHKGIEEFFDGTGKRQENLLYLFFSLFHQTRDLFLAFPRKESHAAHLLDVMTDGIDQIVVVNLFEIPFQNLLGLGIPHGAYGFLVFDLE